MPEPLSATSMTQAGAPDVSGGPLSGLRVTGMRVVPTGVWVQALTTAQITTATAASV